VIGWAEKEVVAMLKKGGCAKMTSAEVKAIKAAEKEEKADGEKEKEKDAKKDAKKETKKGK
jgi:hypothetical protein